MRGDSHTNTVEGFFSILKRGVYGVYQHVSEAHLHRYLTEFDFRYSNREKLGVNDVARASLALAGAKGRRLTYETTLIGTLRPNDTCDTASAIGSGEIAGNLNCRLTIKNLEE